jgi:hypothetical protein
MNREVGARVLAKRDSQIIYNTIPKSQKWLMINCVVNVDGSILLGSTYSEQKDYAMITSNNANQEHVWQCRQRCG